MRGLIQHTVSAGGAAVLSLALRNVCRRLFGWRLPKQVLQQTPSLTDHYLRRLVWAGDSVVATKSTTEVTEHIAALATVFVPA